MRDRPDIQGLRGIAVLLVVLAHAGVPGIAGGFVGVDVFLVVSGYLISTILLHEATATGRVSLTSFYARRARRILPAATVVLATTVVGATLLLPLVRVEQVVTDVAWAAFFAANLHFGAQSVDYFHSTLPASPVQHFWSLAVEEQFYLVWPALVVLVLVLVGPGRRAAPEVRAAWVRRRVPLLTLVVVALCAASLWWSVTVTADAPTAAYFSTPARVWELGAGALLALAGHRLARLPALPAALLRLAGLGLLLVAVVTFDDATAFPGLAALVPVLGTVALLAAGAAPHRPRVEAWLTWWPLRRVGDVSYSFYLWHWPFLVIGGAALADRGVVRSGLLADLLLVAASLAASVVTYHLVENPVRRARVLRWRPRLSLTLWPVALAVVVASGVWSARYVDDTEQAMAARAAAVDVSVLPRVEREPRTGDALHREVAEALDRATLDAPLPFPLEPSLTEIDDDVTPRRDACAADRLEGTSSEVCPVGASGDDVERTVVLLGDSHADMWLPALAASAEENRTRVVPLIKFGCTPLPVTLTRDGDPDPACEQWRAWALQQVADLRPDVVVVGSSTRGTMLDGDDDPVPDGARQRTWREAATSLAQTLRPVSGRVVMLTDLVGTAADSAACLSSREATMGSCTVGTSAAVESLNRGLTAGAQAGGAEAVDVTPMVCSDGRCPAVVGHTVVYRMNFHVTATFARKAADSLTQRLGLDEPPAPGETGATYGPVLPTYGPTLPPAG